MNTGKSQVFLSGRGLRLAWALCLGAAVLIAVETIFAVKFTIDSFPNMSRYEDTTGYLRMAYGATIPEMRAVLYPLILRLLARFSEVNLHLIAYSVQLGFACIAAFYLSLALLKSVLGSRFSWRSSRGRLLSLLPAAMLVDPLNLHFNLAIMPDSMVSSSTLIFVGSLLFIWSAAAARYSIPHIALCTISFTALSLFRLEKPIVAGLVLAVLLIHSFAMYLRRRDRNMHRRILIVLIGVLLIGNTANRFIQHQVPRVDTGKESLSDTRLVLANRLALEVFGGIYDHLGEETRLRMTSEVADKIKARRKNFSLFITPLLRDEPDEARRILDDMIHTALSEKGGAVAAYVMEDLGLYMCTPLAFHYHVISKSRRGSFTRWTLGNMMRQAGVERNPGNYINRYIQVSGALLIFVLVSMSVAYIGSRRRGQGIVPSKAGLLIVLLFHLSNSFFFAFLTNRFHIRYALPSYQLLVLTTYLLFFTYASSLGPPQKDVGSACSHT